MDKLYIKDYILHDGYIEDWKGYIYSLFDLYNITMSSSFNKLIFICRLGEYYDAFEIVKKKSRRIIKSIELRVLFPEKAFNKDIFGSLHTVCKILRKDLGFKIEHG